jgi:hypothetical protein
MPRRRRSIAVRVLLKLQRKRMAADGKSQNEKIIAIIKIINSESTTRN